ncbi:MAG: ABC transporter permease subunit [Myxococcota bacterium]|nr:ABC transporter permease subunit [Myxococcota bacterium]MEC9390898.1 ABC transporter permease subunit [Myxococcota bacterium]
MLNYVIKRLLLMVPTFAAISLVIFVVLNFAPGTPGAQMATGEGGGQDASTAGEQRESYRIFKEQFNLDKPVLFNTRYNLEKDDVAGELSAVLNESGDVPAGRRIEAQENIENWGRYAVPGLMGVLSDETASLRMRSLASQRLTFNAQRQNKNVYKKNLTDAERSEVKAISKANSEVRGWSFKPDATPAEANATVTQWTTWYEANASDWDYGTADRIAIFLFDTRFAKYWTNLAKLNFGVSHVDKRPVLQKVISKLKYSITLSFSSVLLIYAISLPLGIWSSIRQNTLADRVVTTVLFMMYSLPSFFVAVFMLNLLTRGTPLQIFPTSGFESLDTSQMTLLEYIKDVGWHIILPIFCGSYAALAALSRYARSGLLDVIRSDYVRTARAKGLPESVVILKHAARNGMIPILTLLASLLPTLIGGSVVIEVVFGIPGMGSFLFESINLRDYNAVMAVLLISSALTLVGMLISDLSYALVDPRITFE